MRPRTFILIISMLSIGLLQATLPSDRERMELKGPVQKYTVSVPNCGNTNYFFDREGNLLRISEVWDEENLVYFVEREYDESSRLSRLLLRTESGNLLPYKVFSYYSNGSLKTMEEHTWYDDYYSEQCFDESGKLVCIKGFDNDHSLSWEIVKEYNKLGQLISETEYTPDSYYGNEPNYDRHIIFHYDSQGKVISKETKLRPTGVLVEVIQYQYDNQGRIRSLIHKSPKEEPWKEHYSYDSFNNLLEISSDMGEGESCGYIYEYYQD
jgi:antitoxin component YwqK of YwqJK toxin-antitoxin module